MDQLISALKAAGEHSRLRVLCLLAHDELTVGELVTILDQSQPGVSRNLRLLLEADLLERYQEGTQVFYRIARSGRMGELAQFIVARVPEADPQLLNDLESLQSIGDARSQKAEAYFAAIANDWNRIRSLYVSEHEVEEKLLKALEGRHVRDLLDVGTGTGRMLEIFSPSIERGIGVDLSREMLGVARSTLSEKGADNCVVRHGDMYSLPVDGASQDAVIIHQVLHFADHPAAVIKEAARTLRDDGALLLVDFAPHGEEYLREEQAHRRLGFEDDEVSAWAKAQGLALENVEHLEGGKLSVTIWAFHKTIRARKAAE
ncbi:MAG: metalloregulator ArsR/SmtB family transcription factor [Sphingomonadales bacterium]|nr:metalloregulator ArsR/SmtB family transcription factor [Sphingomonadales bacterium]